MSRARLAAAAAALLLNAACESLPESSSAIIPVGGGSAVLTGEAKFLFPENSFDSNTEVVLRKDRIGDFQLILDETTAIFSPEIQFSDPVFVFIQDIQPKKNVKVELRVPNNLTSNLGQNREPIVFVASESVSDLSGPIAYFDSIPGEYNSSSEVITLSIAPSYFTSLARADTGNLFTIIVIGIEKERG